MERWVFKWFPCLMESFVMFLCDKNRLCVTLHFRNAGFTTAPFLSIATAAWSGQAATSEDHGLEPSSIYSWSILEHEFFCLGRLGSQGSKGKKVDLRNSEQLLRVVFSTFSGQNKHLKKN